MNSPKPYANHEVNCDELDCLVRRALKAMVSGQEPPERVWKRIGLVLERDKSPPRQSRMPWLSLAVQPALTLLLVMLGGIGLGRLLNLTPSNRLSSCSVDRPKSEAALSLIP
jgi:hypothetical protein